MSGGNPTLMRTRCPECATVFRVTSEQLRRKAGKVRCGHCQAVFNAFDHWQADSRDENPPPVGESIVPELVPADVSATPDSPEIAAIEFDPAATIVASPDNFPREDLLEALPAVAVSVPDEGEPFRSELAALPPVEVRELGDEPSEAHFDAAETLIAVPRPDVPIYAGELPAAVENPPGDDETPEQSAQAAREAGLVAARELADTAAYNRWAAGTLASDGRGMFDGEEPCRARWPFVIVAALLILALAAQILHHFRTDIVLRLPSLAAAYEALGIDLPLPRNPALVSIETSDLQSDTARGLFVLQATLKNRAAHAQAWPALELSLTDTNDAVVARRVMYAAEYLPPGTTADAFQPNGDVAVRLWIEAKGLGASGYRLYIFYP